MAKKKKVILGVTGSIAAYKAVEIARRLIDKGLDVKTVMTEAATKFIAPLTFETLTKNAALVSLFDDSKAREIYHLSLVEEADLIVVAPATANIIAKAATGVSDDLLSSLLLSAKIPVIFAPAMHASMYLDEATQKNIDTLKRKGCIFVGPEEGVLARGEEGIGRLADVDKIVARVLFELERKKDFADKKIVITSGGTREPLDPVRYLTNRSSGKMGCYLAQEAAKRGAEVTLITTAHSLHYPPPIKTVFVETAEEMRREVFKHFGSCHAVIMAAAVSDFKPEVIKEEKIKRNKEILTLTLKKNPDILKELGEKRRKAQVLVGFAAETENLVKNAKKKVEEKNLDFIVATDVSKKDSGFGKENIEGIFVDKNKKVEKFPLISKEEVARLILDKIAPLLRKKRKG